MDFWKKEYDHINSKINEYRGKIEMWFELLHQELKKKKLWLEYKKFKSEDKSLELFVESSLTYLNNNYLPDSSLDDIDSETSSVSDMSHIPDISEKLDMRLKELTDDLLKKKDELNYLNNQSNYREDNLQYNNEDNQTLKENVFTDQLFTQFEEDLEKQESEMRDLINKRREAMNKHAENSQQTSKNNVFLGNQKTVLEMEQNAPTINALTKLSNREREMLIVNKAREARERIFNKYGLDKAILKQIYDGDVSDVSDVSDKYPSKKELKEKVYKELDRLMEAYKEANA